MARTPTISNRQKAAVILIALGAEITAKVFQHMNEEDVEQLTIEVARLESVSHQDKTNIVSEFRELCLAQEVISSGGIEHARKFLEAAYGNERAISILDRVVQAIQVLPFDFVKKTDAAQIIQFVQEEHPQTIALILAHISASQAAAVLSGLPLEIRAEVARRIAIMDRTPPEVIREIERVLEQKVASVSQQKFTVAGGVKSLVEVLNHADRSTEKMILESLSDNNPELAEEVKKLMFVFEDITILDDTAIQKVLREVDIKELALALKVCGEEVQTRIFKNMSERASNMLKEDMEFMGPVRLRSVEEAQQRIVGVIRRLEDTGEIMIARGGEEEFVV